MLSEVASQSLLAQEDSVALTTSDRPENVLSVIPSYELAFTREEIYDFCFDPSASGAQSPSPNHPPGHNQLIIQEGIPEAYPEWVRSLCKPEDRSDIEHFCHTFPSLTDIFIPTSIIGEGTFSTVYKSIDLEFYKRDNQEWIMSSLQDPGDVVKVWAIAYWYEFWRAKVCDHYLDIQERKNAKNVLKTVGFNPWLANVKGYVNGVWLERAKRVLAHRGVQAPSPRELAMTMREYPPHFVAIKRINATSSPARILDELSFLRVLG